jgi:Kef-type K+ transport system membrane component KefB
MIRKGYVFILLFSLFIAISQSLKYRLFIKRDLSEATTINLLLQIVVLFIVLFVPGYFLVRWYYKKKEK